MMGGFEGGKNKNKDSIYYGKRWDGGLEGGRPALDLRQWTRN